MMLSGFVLSLSAIKRIELGNHLPSVKDFVLGRVIKIYPLYIVCWFAAILILPYSGSFVGKILGVLMLQSWAPVQSIYFSGNAAAWFICDLFFCYLAFIPLMKVIFYGSKRKCLTIRD